VTATSASGPTAADSLVGVAAPIAPSDLRPRTARLLLLRTLVVTIVLGLSLWVLATGEAAERRGLWLQSAVIAATFLSSIVFGVLLRRGLPPGRVVWPMHANDLVLTSLLVYITGGAASPYQFLYALSIVTAGALSYRRGAIAVTVASIVAASFVALAAWGHLSAIQVSSQLKPWEQTGAELIRTTGINIAALIGVGALATIFGDQLQRGAETLATTRRAAADLLTLHQDIVRSLSSGLITTGPDGRVITANQVAADILRAPATALVGKRLGEVMPGLPKSDVEGPRRADLEIATTHIGATVSPLRDVHEHTIGEVINFQDLTDLRRLEQQSRRAERLAIVGQLAAGIAHEIRNPLASISGSIELLRQAPQASDDDRTLMAIVHREIQRLNVLIGDLLDYANPRPMHAADFDLAGLVEETLRVARAEPAFADVELVAEIDQPLQIHADPAKLRQVVWNLVRNARDAAAAGGKHVRVEARKSATVVRIAVRDDGPGIGKELVARIFDPFVTTKEKGTGLGLATCHAVVAEHNGRIDVDTSATGTTMTVTLPLVHSDRDAVEVANATGPIRQLPDAPAGEVALSPADRAR
jgi:two-component system, NtrC family, sensor histidine kinase PilS